MLETGVGSVAGLDGRMQTLFKIKHSFIIAVPRGGS